MDENIKYSKGVAILLNEILNESKYERKINSPNDSTIEWFLGKLDGKASRRVANIILSMVNV